MYFVWIDLSGDYSISIFYLKDPNIHRCLPPYTNQKSLVRSMEQSGRTV